MQSNSISSLMETLDRLLDKHAPEILGAADENLRPDAPLPEPGKDVERNFSDAMCNRLRGFFRNRPDRWYTSAQLSDETGMPLTLVGNVARFLRGKGDPVEVETIRGTGGGVRYRWRAKS